MLYKLAFKKFYKFIKVEILNELIEPMIFGVDGHYYSGVTAKGVKICAIFEALVAILDSVFTHIYCY